MGRLLIALLVLCTASISSAGMQAPRKLVTAAAGGASYTDNFNRSDENPLSGGGVWTLPGGSYTDLKILSNQVTSVSASIGLAYYSTSTYDFSDDQSSSVKIITNDNAYAGPIVRCNSSADNFYRVDVEYGDVKITRRRSDGNGTSWVVASGQTIANKILKLSASGGATTVLRVYIDGVQVGSDTTDSSAYVITGGQPGIHTPSAGVIDDWEGADL